MATIAVRTAVVCALVSGAASTGRGQLPQPPIGALDHTVWTRRDGAPSGVLVLAQSADGVLWLGTSTGLYQFDGVRFEPFHPPGSQPLPSLSIGVLLALPDSTLWIGYASGGVSAMSRRRLVSYSRRHGLPEGTITAIARDSAGQMWAATTTGLARLHRDRWERIGAEQGYPGGMTSDLLVDRRGTLWAPTNAGVFILPRGASRFVRHAPPLDPEGSGTGMPREATDGSVWGASPTLGLTRLSDSVGRPVPLRPAAENLRVAYGLTLDRRGDAWVLEPDSMARVSLAAIDVQQPLGQGDPRLLPAERVPLTGESPLLVLEDREGNVWVPTAGGIERFRETKLTRVSLPGPTAGVSILPADSGAVWLGRYDEPLVLVRGEAVAQAGAPVDISCAYRDLGGGTWFGGPSGIWHAPASTSPSRTRFTRFPLPEITGPGEVQAIALAMDGDLWVSIRGGRLKGVFRRHRGAWAVARLPSDFSNQIALTAVADSAGRVWLGYVGNRLLLAAGDSTRVYSDADGLYVGNVTALLVRGPRLWVGGESGVAMLSDGRFRSLAATETLRGITGIVETPDGDIWLNGADGVTRIAAAELRRALQSAAYRARVERFDYRDGLDSHAPQLRPIPSAVQGSDGRLWFTTETGVVWLDPTNIKRNKLPPPVQIRAVSAAGTDYVVGTRVALPRRTTHLEIAYTALSLSIPDRVKFRYRLSGVDTSWTDAGTRREAFYTNLGPGSYRFQVIAANEDGVWNRTGASVELEIPPTFTQTKAFVVLIAATVAGAIWLLALWRQRQLAHALRAQYEGQLAERARVARELHDTLLGGMAGVAMQLNASARRVAAGDSSTGAIAGQLSTLSSQVRDALAETRRSVAAMRTSPGAPVPLHEQLASTAQRTFAETGVAVTVEYAGTPRPYPPAVEAEIVGIATEAMTNARQHAGCQTVRVTCSYTPGELHVRVRDDGKGFDSSQATPTGHWGLIGMRERVASIGARLTVKSAPSAGTDVVLVLPERSRLHALWSKLVSVKRA